MFADLKFAVRQLLKAPGFTAVAVLALALGIATSTTLFTFFNALLVRPVPFLRDEDTLVRLRTIDAKASASDLDFSIPDFKDIRTGATTLDGVFDTWDRTYILGTGEKPERLLGTWISADGFQTLGVQPTLGRLFRPEESAPGASPVVILGYEIWQHAFGGRAEVIGETITLNQEPVTVIGVMPAGFRFPKRSDLWQPFPSAERTADKYRGDHSWPVYARVKAGVPRPQVQAELDTLAARLSAAHPETNAGIAFRAIRMRDFHTREVRLQMLLLFGSALAVLLIACGNVANLLLARSATRAREVAIRAALGASRFRLVRQVLTESVLLGLLGGAAGLLLSLWEFDFTLGFISVDVPFWVHFDFDWRVFLFALGSALASSALFGSFPAWQLSRTDPANELREGNRGGVGSARGRRIRNGLVVLQMALTLVLLVVAGLTMRSFLNLQRLDPGIDPRHVLTFRTGLPPKMTKNDREGRAFFEQATNQLRQIPGVEAVGFMSELPASGDAYANGFVLEGQPEPKTNHEWPSATLRHASPEVFNVLRIPLLAGRYFDAHDGADTPGVVVVDPVFARRYFPDGKVLGRRLTFDEPDPDRKWLTIVGIVGVVRQDPVQPTEYPGVWQPLAQTEVNFASAVMRVEGDPVRYIQAAADAVLVVRPEIPIYAAKPMTEVVNTALWGPRFFGGLFVGFALIALFLAAIGIYGVTAYSVSQRTQEIGVRMALGAQPQAVVNMVLREGAQLVAAGLALGFAVAWMAVRLLSGILHGIEPHDPPTFAAVPLVLAAVAFVACYLPSRRATLIDPNAALRTE